MKQLLMTLLLTLYAHLIWAQQDTLQKIKKHERLAFAKTYFELGVSYVSSFKGKRSLNGEVNTFDHSASVNQYLTWGAFHFWGHAEFYVTFPMSKFNIDENEKFDYQLLHSVATGARVYPWAMREKKIRPYLGINWSGLDFKQKIKDEEKQTELSKDFLLNYEAGVMYNYKSLAVRLGVNYFKDTKWNYPISKTQKADIKTPPLTVQMGLIYTFESSGNNTKEKVDRWNSYPTLSRLSYGSGKFGDFFIGIGPSLSFSLANSDYNKSELPYLKEKLTSKTYFDMAIGYQFNRANFFTALSYRAPRFVTEGFGSKQTIKKSSLTLEINKFLTDYSGFAPYIGLNVAYDKLDYNENVDGTTRSQSFNKIEPGMTIGWDIVPGKTDEALILRTNLRWYPFSEFEIEGKKFNFSQLEYNLIQVVFYPERFRWKK